MSKSNTNWKDVIVQAMNGSNVNTPLLKLARACYKAGGSKEPGALSSAWLTHAAETAKWALSADAGDQQLMEMDDVPKQWVKAVAEINKAFELGVDFTKINSYHSMGKIKAMLIRNSGGEADDPPTPGTEEADDAEVAERDAQTEADEAEEAANDDVGEEDGDIPDIAEPAATPAEELEPEKKKDPAPKPVPTEKETTPATPDDKINTEDMEFASAIVAAAIKSGQMLDPENIVFCPADLLKVVEMLDALSENKRGQMTKGINSLVKAQYANHLAEKAEGQQRVQSKKDKKAATVKAQAQAESIAKKQGKGKPKLVLPANKDAKAADKAPPKRTSKEDDGFAGDFADLLSNSS